MALAEWLVLHTKYTNHKLVIAFIFLLSILIVGLIIPTQLYAITFCDTSINLTNCGGESSLTSTSSTSNNEIADRPQSDDSETPLIL